MVAFSKEVLKQNFTSGEAEREALVIHLRALADTADHLLREIS